MKKLPKAVAIIGPTASGKSDIALKLAKKYKGEIISADSRTIYREMNIGTAKPPQDTREDEVHESIQDLFGGKKYVVDGIVHWGFDLVSPDESYDVHTYAGYAKEKIEDIIARGKLPIIAGGSGFYAKAIIDNPQYPENTVNQELRSQLDEMSLEEMCIYLQNIDGDAYESIDIQNPVRVKRAVEIIETSGKPWAEQEVENETYLNVLQIGINREREELYDRINARVDKMVAEGLVDEVRELKEKYGDDAPAMTGIGYRQIIKFLNGEMKLRDAIEELKRDTRHLAKRQLTWFKRDERIQWLDSFEEIELRVENFLNE